MRLLSIPARHAYVDAVRPRGVEPVAPDRAVGWEPDPAWADPSLAGATDVVHVHFGFDHLEPAQLAGWLAAVDRPLVVTVHDLRNPHHVDRRRHDEHLALLLDRADAVLTLTDAAAAALPVVATVVPHPAVYAGPTAATEPGLVGLALKSLRRNVAGPDAVVAAVRAAAPAADVTAHQPGHGARVVDRLTDDEHRSWLSRLQVAVLPYRWGTHSGLLEACRDVGTAVVAPERYRQQWDGIHVYGDDEEHGRDAASLTAAVRAALAAGPVAPVDRGLRARQLAENHGVHAATYRRVLARRAA